MFSATLFAKIRNTWSLSQRASRRCAISLQAAFDVAHTKIYSSGLSFRIICKIASINVFVLPVPGGPNKRYGYGYDVCFRILTTADFCSSFISSEFHSILFEIGFHLLYRLMRIFHLTIDSTYASSVYELGWVLFNGQNLAIDKLGKKKCAISWLFRYSRARCSNVIVVRSLMNRMKYSSCIGATRVLFANRCSDSFSSNSTLLPLISTTEP